MKGVVSGASQILPNEAQAPEQARWALGIADVGLQGTRPGRGIESKPNEYATSTIQTDANRQQAEGLSRMHQGGPASMSGAGSAATLLMAASTLAQTPAQSISDALLGQVQLVAAEEQSRRSSQSGPTLSTDGEPTNGVLRSDTRSMPPASTAMASMIGIPPSPRAAATFQVGSIATNAAAQQYLEQFQLLFRGKQDRNSLTGAARQHWDDSNPMQGVPSLPRELRWAGTQVSAAGTAVLTECAPPVTPSASLSMLPPPNMTLGMTTPLSPESVPRSHYFQPT